ncbi:hypothetical protein ACLBR5_18365 [Escherichia coli]
MASFSIPPNRDWEDGYRQRWQHQQNRPPDPRGKLHRLLQLENLRQKRSGHLGNPAD